MSGTGAPSRKVPQIVDARIAIVTAQWHQEISDALLSGAQRACRQAGVTQVQVERVAGSFELPLAAQVLLDSGFDAVVVLGLVLRGETPHFDYICDGVTRGVMDVMLKSGRPIGFGVLMCDTLAQAQARAGLPGSSEDKGFEATVAVLEMLQLQSSLLQ
ncbi:MAG: 6,7-dimethyl-8-ribityllumazine synthase [Actinomycetota bacterium]